MQSFKGPGVRPKSGNSTKEKRASRLFSGKTKFQETQEQIDEITDIMRQNMQSVIERDVKLSELDDRSEILTEKALLFQATAKKVEQKFWKKNKKMLIIIVTLVVVLIGIIGFVLYISLT